MKTYDVTMHQKGLECFPYGITVEVGDKEHPRGRAVSTVCRLGWEVRQEKLQITGIKRVR